ncbi:ankyrin repeat and SOCS box protein 13-like [Stylophora pistillata]|uniref:Ankyrin repeat and SOCS box protein 13 n=1 Tax=Stylophora pistillata TaxID=50429 RepID=A0A2B4SWG4_STYPI|nr:ankyrin repeat and SOCS box protein 13-like [Stylophora pistillata]PFX34231.1 Ankyrin repeat and SOCS box protein 13 [Stylophora pistillata]
MDKSEAFKQIIRENRYPPEYIKNLLACLEVSINYGSGLNQQTALHIAARQGDVDMMKMLISQGAYVNQGTVDLMTPLHEACLNGHTEAVNLLIAEGADTDARNIDGSTPLCFACAKGSVMCTRLLIECGAEVNPSLTVTFPPLHEAALNGHIPCLEILIEKGADLEKNENQFGTALHVACLRGHVECVIVLLQAGANPNSIKRHQAPLHTTAMNGDEVCTALLLEYGANVYLRDQQSKKPVDLTTNAVCKEMLLEAETPPELLESCRRLIRQQLSCHPRDKIPVLPLPQNLKDYLNHYNYCTEHY